MKTVWVDGSFEPQTSMNDAGFLLGHGVFETIGIFDGAFPLWPAHLRRLEHGADTLEIPFEPRSDLQDIAGELLDREHGDDIVRITLTVGIEGKPTWCLTTRRRSASEDPIRLHALASTAPRRRFDIKTTSRAFFSMMMNAAQEAGADDALLLDADGSVLETTTANVFFWSGDKLRTPRLDGRVLPGVGREALIASIATRGVSVEESDWTMADLENSDGILVTNAVYGPRPASLPDVDAVPLRRDVLEAWRIATSPSGV